MELGFILLQLIYVKNKQVVSISVVYASYMPSIYLQYIGFGDYLYTIDLSCEWDEHL